jgi:peroxiredoxin
LNDLNLLTRIQLTCGVRKLMNLKWPPLAYRFTYAATTLSTDAWKGKKVVLVSVPGAFTVRTKYLNYNDPSKAFSSQPVMSNIFLPTFSIMTS